MYGCRIELQHDQAQTFFEEALHPDMEELQRRDAFFEQLEEEMDYQIDGANITIEIPDVDIDALLNEGKAYIQTDNFLYVSALNITDGVESQDHAYTIKASIDVAA